MTTRPKLPDELVWQIEYVCEREGYPTKTEFVKESVRSHLRDKLDLNTGFFSTVVDEGTFEFGQNPFTKASHSYQPNTNMFLVGPEQTPQRPIRTLAHTAAQTDDLLPVVISSDPTFQTVINELGCGTRVQLTDEYAINPLQIDPHTTSAPSEETETLLHEVETRGESISHSEQGHSELPGNFVHTTAAVGSFFRAVCNEHNIDLGDRASTLDIAIRETYHQADITRDAETHHHPAPTVPDVIATLQDIADNPSAYTYQDVSPGGDTLTEADILREHAQQLICDLDPLFRRNGSYTHLNARSNVSLETEDLVWFDAGTLDPEIGIITLQAILLDVFSKAMCRDDVLIIIPESEWLLSPPLQCVPRMLQYQTRNVGFALSCLDADPFVNTELGAELVSQCRVKHLYTDNTRHLAEFGCSEQAAEYVASTDTSESGIVCAGTEHASTLPR